MKIIYKMIYKIIYDMICHRMLDYEYFKNHYRLIVVDLSWQKELNADLKAIQQIEFDEQFKNKNCVNANGIQSMFVLTNSEKFNETRLKLSQGGLPVL